MVVGSPSTLGADRVWRAWLAWVRDRGAFLTPNALPPLPWEADAAADAEREEARLRALEAAAEVDADAADAAADAEALHLDMDPEQDTDEVVASAGHGASAGSLGMALRSADAGDVAWEHEARRGRGADKGNDEGDDEQGFDSVSLDSDAAVMGDAPEPRSPGADASSAGAGSSAGGAGSKGFSGADLEGWLDGS